MRAPWLVNQLWFTVPVNSWKFLVSSELSYKRKSKHLKLHVQLFNAVRSLHVTLVMKMKINKTNQENSYFELYDRKVLSMMIPWQISIWKLFEPKTHPLLFKIRSGLRRRLRQLYIYSIRELVFIPCFGPCITEFIHIFKLTIIWALFSAFAFAFAWWLRGQQIQHAQI